MYYYKFLKSYTLFQRIRRGITLFWLTVKGEPVRTWRKVDSGKYFCDGDCGRFALHGVCTCGLCHYFKFDDKHRDVIERDIYSWVREADTYNHMIDVPFRTICTHGTKLEFDCPKCLEEFRVFANSI